MRKSRIEKKQASEGAGERGMCVCVRARARVRVRVHAHEKSCMRTVHAFGVAVASKITTGVLALS